MEVPARVTRMCSSLLRISTVLLVLACMASTNIGFAKPLSDSSDDAGDDDQSISVQLTRKQAEKGNSTAQYNLGVMYSIGKGVDQDPRQAAKWFRKAADNGLVDAQYNFGLMLALGQGGAVIRVIRGSSQNLLELLY